MKLGTNSAPLRYRHRQPEARSGRHVYRGLQYELVNIDRLDDGSGDPRPAKTSGCVLAWRSRNPLRTESGLRPRATEPTLGARTAGSPTSLDKRQEARDHSAASSAPRTAGLPGTWASRSATGCTRSVVHQWRSLRLWPSSAPLFYPDTFACVSAAPFSASGWIVLSRLFKSSRGDHGSP